MLMNRTNEGRSCFPHFAVITEKGQFHESMPEFEDIENKIIISARFIVTADVML